VRQPHHASIGFTDSALVCSSSSCTCGTGVAELCAAAAVPAAASVLNTGAAGCAHHNGNDIDEAAINTTCVSRLVLLCCLLQALWPDRHAPPVLCSQRAVQWAMPAAAQQDIPTGVQASMLINRVWLGVVTFGNGNLRMLLHK
jgi:hypothetical protein